MPFRMRITTTASEDRLEALLLERMAPGADREAVDARIWDLFGEQWAVMFTDLSGFSKGAAKFGIVHFLQTILESHRVLIPAIDRHDGILIKSEADSLLVLFRNPSKAVECALSMQRELETFNVGRALEEQVLLCVGLGYGPILKIGDADVFGAEVNASSKLGEDIAEAREILVTEALREAVAEGYTFERIDAVPPGSSAAYRLLTR